jgi:predicted amidohydrolase
MNVLLLQTDVKWQSPAENCRRMRAFIDSSPQSDLVIMPEMFSTGFCVSPQGVAEPSNSSPTLEWMLQTAAETCSALAGSLATEENGACFNRFYFVKPDGTYSFYDKRHLFSYAGEDSGYTAGTERVVVSWLGTRILLQVCYDLRFPVFSRNRNDYDMAVYVANWPVQRIAAWSALLTARAVENQCYVAGVNRTGTDPAAEYSGCSMLVDFKGRAIVSTEPAKECALNGYIDMQALDEFRKRFPVLNDADEFNVNLNRTETKNTQEMFDN